ncbi:MAG: type II toxin-antitoxin system VapC family toxin [Candidatus Dormibacteraceae bacterium]
MIVVDASIFADSLVDDTSVGDAVRGVISRDQNWAAPTHVRVEVASVIRKSVLAGKVSSVRGQKAIFALMGMTIKEVDSTPLLPRIWELKDNLTIYDAVYVAIAELLGCSLITSDARLSRAPGLRCPIHLCQG